MFAFRRLTQKFAKVGAYNEFQLLRHELILPQEMAVRWRHSARINTSVVFVPQQESWIVERMGRFHRILDPGVNFLIPVVDQISYVQSLKELAIDIPQQSAVTADNVVLNIDGVLYLRVVDPYAASYGVEDPEFAITQLAQTTMRSEIGKITLDSVFKERESLNIAIVESINTAGKTWGLTCMRYEIRDISLPSRVAEAMQMQVEAERKKRAAILESEGKREADINIAEGLKRARILASEALKLEQINSAEGEAKAIIARAQAKASGIKMIGEMIKTSSGENAAALNVAEQYVKAFSQLAKTNNTIILSNDASDVAKMTAQALQVFRTLKTSDSDIIGGKIDEKNTEEKSRVENQFEYYSDLDNKRQ
ncbi:stomatin-like protein 2, mitochondrial [Oppia nitens]|uniref:stomatin-like protein 2, mitochondrial n=1 Tax=Oppia nitens TaxID=1686743 RepID=UPI0023D9B79F|nr:stomatin-like protein 2, mitochondrial [Oppia nitens]